VIFDKVIFDEVVFDEVIFDEVSVSHFLLNLIYRICIGMRWLWWNNELDDLISVCLIFNWIQNSKCLKSHKLRISQDRNIVPCHWRIRTFKIRISDVAWKTKSYLSCKTF
jgi:hypothetical protein